MILACPSCATRFAIADHVLADGARKVRCTQCRHVWTADRGMAVEEAASVSVSDPAQPQAEDSAEYAPAEEDSAPPENFAAALAEIAPDLVETPPPAAPVRQWLQSAFLRRLVAAVRKLRITRWQAKAASAVLLAAILLLLVVARHPLSARVPFLTRLYAMAGLQQAVVDQYLELQLTRAEKCLEAGRDMLCLEGTVTQKEGAPAVIPTIAVTALGVDGQPLTGKDGEALLWKIKAGGGKLHAGEERRFSTTVGWPEQAVADFDYGFINDEDRNGE